MGKGRIIEEIGDGLYRIELDKGEFERDVQLSQINDLLQGEELALLSADVAVIDAENALRAEVAELNRLIDELNKPPEAEPSEGEDEPPPPAPIADRINDAVLDVERARLGVKQAQQRRSELVMQLAEIKAKRDELEALEVTETVEAWCTDGEPEMTGEIGTVEVPGEPIGPILIKPGFEWASGFDPVADGRLIQRTLMGGAQAYLNAALLPGWQKWRPTYRFGTITALDETADTCSIELEPSESSAQALDVTPDGPFTAVPIEYRECNAAAFEAGDSVLIEYRGQLAENPVVIGFKDNPRYCDPYITISYSAFTSAYAESWCNYLVWDIRKEEVVKELAKPFTPNTVMRMNSAVINFGGEPVFSTYKEPQVFTTETDISTVASVGKLGYRIKDEGLDIDIVQYSIAADAKYIYALDFSREDDVQNILKIDSSYSVIQKMPVPVPENTFALSEPYKNFIACAGFDGDRYPFIALFNTSTGERLYYSTFGPEFGYVGGYSIGLGARGIAICDFDGVLHIHQPVDWSDLSKGWIKYDLGNIVYFPEGVVMTDDHLFINQRLGTDNFKFRRYSFVDGEWKDYGDIYPSGVNRRITGYMRTVRKAL